MRWKLVSPKDTLLGHLDGPDDWQEYFAKQGMVRAALFQKLSMVMPKDSGINVAADITTITLTRARWSQFPDAVCLVEGSIEQLETMPGVSFTPGAAYLRSLID